MSVRLSGHYRRELYRIFKLFAFILRFLGMRHRVIWYIGAIVFRKKCTVSFSGSEFLILFTKLHDVASHKIAVSVRECGKNKAQ
jgi:hypothetical protein